MLCPSALSSNRSVTIVHLTVAYLKLRRLISHGPYDAFTVREDDRVRRVAAPNPRTVNILASENSGYAPCVNVLLVQGVVEWVAQPVT